MKFKWLISLGLVVCLVLCFALPMCAPAPPAEEEAPVEEEEEELAKSIKAYCSLTTDNAKLLMPVFEEELGVKVLYTIMSCGEVEARMMAETPNFNADIAMTCARAGLHAKAAGWAQQYDCPIGRDAVGWRDPDNYWFGGLKFSYGIVGHKELLAKAGYTMPDSYEDLLDPKWKDQIVMPSPLSSGTALMMLYSFITLYGFNADKGEEGGWEYWEALNKNVHHYTRSGNAPTDLVGRGEFMLGVTSDEMILNRLNMGYPIEFTIPKEGTGWEGGANVILKGTKELYTAQKVMDVLFDRKAAEAFAKMGYSTRFADIPSPLYERLLGGPPKYIPNIDRGWAFENQDRILEKWEEVIGREAQ